MAPKKTKARKGRATPTSGRRKPTRAKRSQAVAEKTGLVEGEVLLSEATSRLSPEQHSPDMLDRQFNFWMTVVRTSPWPSVLHQQIRFARAVMEFCLPTKSERK